MSAFQQYIDQSRVSQYHQDRMREAATERFLKVMRAEQLSDREAVQMRADGAVPRPSGLRHAWSELVSFMASFL